MILRNLVSKTFFKKLFQVPDKFAYVAFAGQPNKSICNVIAVSNIPSISICDISCEYNLPQNTIPGSRCQVKKRFYSSKKKKDDDLQPELKENVLEKGDFALSQTHFDRKIQNKDVGSKYTVGEDVITALNNVYGIERRLALTMMRSQKFLLVADSTILQTMYFLAKKNISPEQIQRIPWLLLYESEILQDKMDLLLDPHLFQRIEDGLGFCYLPKQRIHNTKTFFQFEVHKFPYHRNRLYCMAELLNVPVAHLTERIVKPYRLMSMNFERIVKYMDLLKSYNVSNDDILRDLWVFFHNIKISEKRLRRINEAGCTRPRLWMCRCIDDVFETSVKHYEDKKLILGGSMTVVEYLSEQLEWSPDEIELHCASHSNLLRIRVSKLQSIMELLLAEGITREAIRAAPRILEHSEKMLRSRIQRLKELGYQPTHCPTLLKSKSRFDKICNSIKDHNLRMEYSSQDTSTNGIKNPWISPSEARPF